LAQSFGIQLELKPIKLKGRVLEAPKVLGSDRGVNIGKQLDNWLFYNVSPEVHSDWKTFQ